jgi:hypothetical protein
MLYKSDRGLVFQISDDIVHQIQAAIGHAEAYPDRAIIVVSIISASNQVVFRVGFQSKDITASLDFFMFHDERIYLQLGESGRNVLAEQAALR